MVLSLTVHSPSYFKKMLIPPIKSQGIKTKLVDWIASTVPSGFGGVWIEPFMGTGVVGLNIAPKKAILCDTNPHLIRFYNELKSEKITPQLVRVHLEREGALLEERGAKHYYDVRERFNKKHSPLDFIFVNRAGFNGMIRFNKKGQLNIPFCHKPKRYAKAYVTRVVNQVSAASKIIREKEFVFLCQPFEKTLSMANEDSIIYCDPPYIGRHVDYYNGWTELEEKRLFELLSITKASFLLSTWHHNDFRSNPYIKELWSEFKVLLRSHFYHVGGKEKNRNPMVEALITNISTVKS
ncbi:MAG: DNA adenine methylase [Proteobacteria bacterium]|nr:DNA adenine methylase [Pseudomonadota bacterium]